MLKASSHATINTGNAVAIAKTTARRLPADVAVAIGMSIPK